MDNQYYVVHEGVIGKMRSVSLDGLPESIRLHLTTWIKRTEDSFSRSSKGLSVDSDTYKGNTKSLNALYQLFQVAVANLRHNYKVIQNIGNYSSKEKESNPFYLPAKKNLKSQLFSQCNNEALKFDPENVLKVKMLSQKLDQNELLDELWAKVNREHFNKTWEDVRKRERDVKKMEEEWGIMRKQHQSFQIDNNELREELGRLRRENQGLRDRNSQLIREGKQQSEESGEKYKANFKELEDSYEQLIKALKDTATRKEEALLQQVRLTELKASRMEEEYAILFTQKYREEIERRAKEIAAEYIKQEFPFK
ncbi:MAG: hypothetical protein ACRBG0_04990 [Lewinella sp.]|uniref:hypothetical protein n=1 Tax=Lewinella sp. TaxID=2004506 RepID=UPI003D6A5833